MPSRRSCRLSRLLGTGLAALLTSMAAPAVAGASDPLPASCAAAKAAHSGATDGPQMLEVRGRAVEIYCAEMDSASPSSWLTLPAGPAGNFSTWEDAWLRGDGTVSHRTATRTWEKVPIDLNSLTIPTCPASSNRFASFQGDSGFANEHEAFGCALRFGTAKSRIVGVANQAPGHGRIDLRGTPFSMVTSLVPYSSFGYGPSGAWGFRAAAKRQLFVFEAPSSYGFLLPPHGLYGVLQLDLLPAVTVHAPTPTPANNTPVVMTPEQVRRALFLAAELPRFSERPEEAVLERVLQAMFALRPDLGAAAANEEFDALRAALPSAPDPDFRTPNARVVAALRALSDANRAGVAGDAVRLVAARAVRATAGDAVTAEHFNAAVDNGGTLTAGHFAPQAVLADTSRQASENHAFGVARDTAWSAAGAPSVFASTGQLRSGPQLAGNTALTGVAALIDADGGLRSTVGALDAIAAQQLNQLYQETDRAVAFASEIGAGRLRPGDVAVEVHDRIERVDDRLQALTFTSQSLSTSATRLSKTIGTLAAAGSLAAGAYSKWSLVTTHSSGAQLRQMGSAALAGNLALTVLTLVPLFMDSGPNADQLILDQIAETRQQIEDFRVEVHERFDRVDRALNDILDDLAEANRQLLSTTRDVNGIYGQVSGLSARLDSLQSNLFQALRDERNANLRDAIDYALGYPQLSQADFRRAAITFTNTATVRSLDTIALGPEPVFQPDSVFAQMGNPLASNVDYLRRFPAEQPGYGLNVLGADRLPNPEDWSLGARALSQLLVEHPNLVTDRERGQLAQVIAMGSRLQDAFRVVGERTGSGPSGSALFDRLLADHRADVAALDTALEDLRDRIAADLQGYDGLKRPAAATDRLRGADGNPIDLWGAPGQGTDIAPSNSALPATVEPCVDPNTIRVDSRPFFWFRQAPAGADPSNVLERDINDAPYPASFAISRPSNVDFTNVPASFGLAHRLGLGQLRVCWTATREDLLYSDRFGNLSPIKPGFCGSDLCGDGNTYSTLKVRFEWKYRPASGPEVDVAGKEHRFVIYADCDFWGRTGRLGATGIPRTSTAYEFYSSPSYAVYALWSISTSSSGPHPCVARDYFVQRAVDAPPPDLDQRMAEIDAAVNRGLGEHQRQLYQAVLDSEPQSLEATKVATALKRVDGNAKLVRAYATLGLASALATDDDLREALTALLDRASALAGYRAAITTIAAAGRTAQDVRPALVDPAAAEAAAAAAMLGRHLRSGGSARAPRAVTAAEAAADQTPQLVRTTMDRLRLTAPVLAAPAEPQPPVSQPDPPAPEPPGTEPPAPGDTDVTPSPAATGAPAPGQPPAAAALKLSGVRLAKSRFARRAGTTLRFTLSRATGVDAVISRARPGRRTARGCSPTARRGKRCTALTVAKRLRLSGRQGANQAKIGKGLARGQYQLALSVPNGGKRVLVAFTVR